MQNSLKEHAKIINANLEKILPKELNAEWLEFALGKPKWGYDEETCTNAISKPAWDLLSRGGKRWRPFLMLLSYKAVGGKSNSIWKYLAIPELIHNGTLIIDDIEDNSNIRRGKACIHKIYGRDIAINAGNALYYIPCLSIIRNKDLDPNIKVKMYDLIMEEMIKISFGQGMDIYWHRGGKKNITEKQYLQMCAYKTGTLARMSAKLGAILADSTKEQADALGEFAESIGVAFQIQDDILNISKNELGKEIGDDITEGKRTLMVIRLMEKALKEDKRRLMSILNIHTREKRLVDEAIGIIKKYDTMGYAREKANEIVVEAWQKLDPLISPSKYKKQLKEFAEFVVKRRG